VTPTPSDTSTRTRSTVGSIRWTSGAAAHPVADVEDVVSYESHKPERGVVASQARPTGSDRTSGYSWPDGILASQT
jgi:hypothetical protein